MGDVLSVRPWRLPEDAEGIARIAMQSLEHHRCIDPDPVQPSPSFAQVLRAALATNLDDGRLRLVAEVHGDVVGFVHAEVRRDEEYGWCGSFVHDLAAAEGCRNQGIGTLLLTSAEGWARDQGARSSALDTLVTNNQAAIRLYEGRGDLVKGLVLGRRL